MSFSSRLKDEICTLELDRLSMISELSAIMRYDGVIEQDKIQFTFENPTVARRVYKDIKTCFNISPHVITREQKRLRSKPIYILEIKESIHQILESLYIEKKGKKIDMNLDYLSDQESMISYVRGAFLVTGSVSNPATSGYHLEYVFLKKKDAEFLKKMLTIMKFHFKVAIRNSRYMLYIKNSEEISDMLRMFEATNSLFQFEDIRIYRDHKNMVNRLNNCEIANQEKSTQAGIKQLDIIHQLKEYDIYDLLDEKTKIILDYRNKYPESSYQELSDIIFMETDYKIGKSGINHHFIKAKKLLEQYEQKNQNQS